MHSSINLLLVLTFCLARLVFYYMHKEPWITKPPATPLPDYSSIRNFTGEVYLQYPIQPNPTPAHFGASFLAQIGLNTIMLEINKAASSAGSPGTAPPTLAQAIQLYKKLNDWYKALPDVLQPSKIVMPHHLQIQSVDPYFAHYLNPNPISSSVHNKPP